MGDIFCTSCSASVAGSHVSAQWRKRDCSTSGQSAPVWSTRYRTSPVKGDRSHGRIMGDREGKPATRYVLGDVCMA